MPIFSYNLYSNINDYVALTENTNTIIMHE